MDFWLFENIGGGGSNSDMAHIRGNSGGFDDYIVGMCLGFFRVVIF